MRIGYSGLPVRSRLRMYHGPARNKVAAIAINHFRRDQPAWPGASQRRRMSGRQISEVHLVESAKESAAATRNGPTASRIGVRAQAARVAMKNADRKMSSR